MIAPFPRYSIYWSGGGLASVAYTMRAAYECARLLSHTAPVMVRDDDTRACVILKEGRVL